MNLRSCLIAAAGVMLTASLAFGLQAKLSLQEIAQNADLIFVGTVARQDSHYNARRTAIETDVTFTDVSIEHESDRAQQRGARTIHLTYAGGQVGDVTFGVSDSPAFETGHRYLVFMNDDGSRPFNPVIGAFQGMFEVLSDPVARQEYLRTPGGRAVVGVDDDGNVRSSSWPIDSVSAGVPAFRRPAEPPVARAPAPEPVGPGSVVGRRAGPVLDAALETPMTIDEFIDQVRNVSLKKKVDRPQLLRERSGRFYHQVDGAIVSQPLEGRALDVTTIDEKLRQAGLSVADNSLGADGGATVSTSAWYEPLMNCGRRQSWPFTMETLESNGWEWFATYDNPLTYNNYVDLFRPIGPYPGWGWNGANEFLGFPSDAELIAAYGFGMGGSLALTISVAVDGWCNTIVESDIAWSPWKNWTDNYFYELENPYALNLNVATMHELGHTVGLSRTLPENYDYPYLTYMLGAGLLSVTEDGRGLHAADAINLRANYGSTTNIADMGVESYFKESASFSPSNSWLTSPGPDYGTNRLRTPLHPGDTFTANQLTVENVSQFAHSNVHIRLYLSIDPTINALDSKIGDWYWPTFWGDSYWEGDLTATVPPDTPPGTYYVGAWVTINGYQGDGYSPNNTTFFADRLTITAAVPTVVTAAASGIGTFAATMNGTVNPNGTATTAFFQYGLTTSYGYTTPMQSLGSGTADVAVGAGSVTGLSCNTLHHFRAVGTNDGGTTNGSDLTFTTTACPPTVATSVATNVAVIGATLNGTVNPNGTSTTAVFEFGLTTNYGSQATAAPVPGSGTSSVAVSAAITGLSCNTTYHFRAVATNAPGTTFGLDAVFTTLTTARCAFTDDPLLSGIAVIKAVHFTELRLRIDALRARFQLPAFNWTDPSVTVGETATRLQHIVDLRTALSQVYAAIGRQLPTYTDPSLGGGTTMKVVHIAELRAAVVAIE